MRSVRMRILATLLVLAAVGVGGWQLLPSQEDKDTAIKVGTTDAVTSLDPAGAYDAGSWALFSNVFQTLLTFEPGGVQPVPDAAKSCGFVGSGLKTYRCELKSGLTFSSGRKMTAEDVKYSFDRVKKINAKVGPASLLSTLGSTTTSGNFITFHLSSADATFPFKVATGAGSIVDPSKYSATAVRKGDSADGSGPYTLTSYDAGKKAELAPNPKYKGAVSDTGKPIELDYYASSDALAKSWKAKEVDVATRQLPPSMTSTLSASDPDIRVSESDSAETRNLYLNVRASSPLHDTHVRQAMAWLIDREQLASKVYDGTVDPLYSLIPAGITGHTTSFFDTYPKVDVSKAKALLAEAGVTTPVEFTFGYSTNSGQAAAEAKELKRELEAGGLFKVDLKAYEWTAFQSEWSTGKLDSYAVGWVPDYPDPDTFAGPLVGSGSTMATGYSNRDADKLISASQNFADRSRVTEDFTGLQQKVAEDVPLLPLWQAKEYVVSTEDVGGGQYLLDGTGIFRLWSLNWI